MILHRLLLSRVVLLVLFSSVFILNGGLAAQPTSTSNPPVAVLILDDFQGRPLGTIEDPVLGALIYTQINKAASEIYREKIEELGTVELIAETFDCSSGIQCLPPNDDFSSLDAYCQNPDFSLTVACQAHAILLALTDAALTIVNGYPGAVPSAELCIAYLPNLSASPQGEYYITGAGPSPGVAHGLVVSQTIVDAAVEYSPRLEWLTMAGTQSYVVAAHDSVSQPPVSIPIAVYERDTEHFDLPSIVQLLSQVVNNATNTEVEDYAWVVNASFAIIPCDRVAGLTARIALATSIPRFVVPNDLGSELLKLAVNAVISETHESTQETLASCGLELVSDGPIFSAGQSEEEGAEASSYIQPSDGTAVHEDCTTLRDVIQNINVFVASAGNVGLNYPFYPAAEPSVVSVSATLEDLPFLATDSRSCATQPQQRQPCSNAGEVLMPGVVTYNGITYFGTSFAAPRLSLRLAVYLARYGANVCGLLNLIDPANGQSVFPDVPLHLLPVEASCGQLQQMATEVFMD